MTKRKPVQRESQPPQISPVKAIELLEAQIEKGKQLLASRPIKSDDYSSWKLVTKNFLEKAFGANSPNVTAITTVGAYGSFPMNAGESWWENHHAESLETQLTKLRGLIDLLSVEVRLQQGTEDEPVPLEFGHEVFLVHGHDFRNLSEIARFLEKLDQAVVILHEKPNQGRTLIEKFEDYSNVGYAVVLLTPDDEGGPIGLDNNHPRARQNVIFELGYFIGKLGRNRVCALYVPGVELPSDISGVVYVELDEENAWRFSLAKELKAAGFPVDMNKAV